MLNNPGARKTQRRRSSTTEGLYEKSRRWHIPDNDALYNRDELPLRAGIPQRAHHRSRITTGVINGVGLDLDLSRRPWLGTMRQTWTVLAVVLPCQPSPFTGRCHSNVVTVTPTIHPNVMVNDQNRKACLRR
jgi:hypothetical protein